VEFVPVEGGRTPSGIVAHLAKYDEDLTEGILSIGYRWHGHRFYAGGTLSLVTTDDIGLNYTQVALMPEFGLYHRFSRHSDGHLWLGLGYRLEEVDAGWSNSTYSRSFAYESIDISSPFATLGINFGGFFISYYQHADYRDPWFMFGFGGSRFSGDYRHPPTIDAQPDRDYRVNR
jgi:hypothetical protein